MLHCVDLNLCFTFAVDVQLPLMLAIIFSLLHFATCFGLINHHQLYKFVVLKESAVLFSFVFVLCYFYVGILLLLCIQWPTAMRGASAPKNIEDSHNPNERKSNKTRKL
jgi:hypothetical protein